MNKVELEAKLKQIESILDSTGATEISLATESALNDLFFQTDEFQLSDREQLDIVIAIIEHVQSRIKTIKQKVKGLFRLIETDSNTVRVLELYLIKYLKTKEIDHLETRNYGLEIVLDSSQRELIIDKDISITDVPEEYQKFFFEIDYSSVRETLESGEKLDFASLSQPKFHLKIDKS